MKTEKTVDNNTTIVPEETKATTPGQDLRDEHTALLSAMDKQRARLTTALMLLGVNDTERRT